MKNKLKLKLKYVAAVKINFNRTYDILLGLLKVMNLCEPHSSVFIHKDVNYTQKIYINRNQADYTLCLCVHIEFKFDWIYFSYFTNKRKHITIIKLVIEKWIVWYK